MNYLLISTSLTAKTALKALSVRQTPYPNRTTVAVPYDHCPSPCSLLNARDDSLLSLWPFQRLDAWPVYRSAVQTHSPWHQTLPFSLSAMPSPRIWTLLCKCRRVIWTASLTTWPCLPPGPARVGCRRIHAALASEVLYFVRTDRGMSIKHHRRTVELCETKPTRQIPLSNTILTYGILRINKILKLL